MVSIDLVYSIHDPTEVAIQKMIDASQRMIDVQSRVTGEAKDGWGINPVMKRHLELEIKTLQNAPRDAVATYTICLIMLLFYFDHFTSLSIFYIMLIIKTTLHSS